MTHLTPEQISTIMIGDRAPEVSAHLASCQECAGRLEDAARPVALFGAALRGSADNLRLPVVQNEGFDWGMFRWRATSMALVASVALLALPVYRMQNYHRTPVAVKTIAPVTDEALLRKVELEVSRSVPAPMETLAALMATDSKGKVE